MKKLAYIAIDYGLVSETFISDSVELFANSLSQFELIYQTRHTTTSLPFNTHQINFGVLTSFFDRVRYRFLNDQTRIRMLQQNATRKLLPVLLKVNPDIVYTDYASTAILIYPVMQRLKIPFVVHLHGADITVTRSVGYDLELKRAFYRAARQIAASDHIRRLAILKGSNPSKVEVIRLGINNAGIHLSANKTNHPSVIFIGRLTAKKNPLALIHAFRLVVESVPDAKLTIIGEGELRDQAEQLIESLHLRDHVVLEGAKPNQKVLELLSMHWVYTQHSVTASNGDQEGFGVSIAEAASLGLPVVSTLHNGIPEQVIHGETGFLCREYDFESMAAHIKTLLLDEELRKKFGEHGRKNILSLCDPEIRKKKLLELIESI